MNVCLLVKDFAVGKKFDKNGLPNKSGAEFHAENHALQLIKLGNAVTIMAKKRYYFTKARENLNGIDLIRLHAPFRWLEIILRLITTHRNIDSFYILGTPKFAVWAVIMAKLLGKPVTMALTRRDEIFDTSLNWRNKIFSKCDQYVAISHEIERGFIQNSKISPNKVTVLPQGIDTLKYTSPSIDLKQKLKQQFGLQDDTPVVLFCARVVIGKGIDTLMKVWVEIHKKIPNAKLFVVGGGLYELLTELKELSKKLDNSIEVIGEVDNPQEYYQVADVYIFPSRQEGLPTTLIEAMSSGLPAVVSDIGGCEDLTFNDKTGYRVNSEDTKGFIDRTVQLLENPKLRRQFSKNAVDFAREYCDYNKVIPRLQAILQSKTHQ